MVEIREDMQKIIADFGAILQKYTELPNRKCIFNKTDVTLMQMWFFALVGEIEKLSEVNNG